MPLLETSQVTEATKLDLNGVYIIVGFLIISNIGTIVTTVIALVKGVYRFAEVAGMAKALHQRVDRLEKVIDKLLSTDD